MVRILDLRQRLVDFHAGAAGIGENDLDAFAFEGFDEEIAPEHRGADLGARLGVRLETWRAVAPSFGATAAFAFADSVVLLMDLSFLWRHGRSNKKPTAVSSRGFC